MISKKIETPTLETTRLLLEPISMEHTSSLQKYFNNWNVIKNLNDKIPWPFPDNGIVHHLENMTLPRVADGSAMAWAITLKTNPAEAIGRLDYRSRLTENDQKERGFWLGEPFWGQGYMSEAVTCLHDYIFDVLGKENIIVQNYTDNIGSRRIKEKTGATFIKTKPSTWRGEERDLEIWELTAENWKKFREK